MFMLSRSNCPDINSLGCFSFLVASRLQLAGTIFQLAEGTSGGAVVEGHFLLQRLGQQEIMFGKPRDG